MGNIFSYDSKVMRALMYVGDMIILNILFLICSIPLVTIGAAQTGLYTGIRVLQDPEDDSSPAAAFFKGFANGFLKITLVWVCFMFLFVFLAFSLVPAMASVAESSEIWAAYAQIPHVPPVLSAIALVLCELLYNMLVMFHTRFNCSLAQLFRNSVLMTLAHPLRSILAAGFMCIPFLVLVYNFYLFMQITPVFAAVGFCGLSMLSFGLLNKPFRGLINDTTKAAAEQTEAKTLTESEEPVNESV